MADPPTSPPTPQEDAPLARTTPPELEEERLDVERAKAGDRRALARILRRHGPVLYRSVLLPRLGSREAAEDALSITYTKVVEKFAQFTWQHVGVYPWLRVIALHVALDHLRTRRREVPFDADDLARELERTEQGQQGADAETLARQDTELARARVTQALATINARYATAIRLRILEERSREEAAQELGISTATFDVVLHRALVALKKTLSSSMNEQES